MTSIESVLAGEARWHVEHSEALPALRGLPDCCVDAIVTDPPPPGGLILDPFCGSGSGGIGAVMEGLRFIGIEREDTEKEPFVSIARARINHIDQYATKQISLFDSMTEVA